MFKSLPHSSINRMCPISVQSYHILCLLPQHYISNTAQSTLHQTLLSSQRLLCCTQKLSCEHFSMLFLPSFKFCGCPSTSPTVHPLFTIFRVTQFAFSSLSFSSSSFSLFLLCPFPIPLPLFCSNRFLCLFFQQLHMHIQRKGEARLSVLVVHTTVSAISKAYSNASRA